MACLQVIGVSYEVAGRRLLHDVSLAIEQGEVLVVAGPNGAGKSTLLKLLAGDLDPSAGRVLLDGQPIDRFDARELALRRAVLPQQVILQFAFHVEEVVMMGRYPHQERRASDPARDHLAVETAMARSETTHLARRTFPSLSGGEQARVSLARVLAQETPILLLDEPTASLDLRHQELVLDVARSLAAGGAAVLAILHDLNLAAAHADRMALLHEGRLVACGSPWAVLDARLLSRVFDHPIAVAPHPLRPGPLVTALPRASPPASPVDHAGSAGAR